MGTVAAHEGVLNARPPAHPLRPRPLRKLGTLFLVAVAVLALGLAALMVVPAALGYERHVITGESMSGSIERGSIVFGERVPVSELREGDVITYEPPREAGVEGPVTHRIETISGSRERSPLLRTKGDANQVADPWTFRPDQPTQPRVAFQVPYVGYAFEALAIPWVAVLVIGLAALGIGFGLLKRHEGREQARAVAAAPAPASRVPAPAPVTAEAVPAPVTAEAPPALATAEAPAAGGGHSAAPASPDLVAELRGEVERLRRSSRVMMEGVLRLRGRLDAVPDE